MNPAPSWLSARCLALGLLWTAACHVQGNGSSPPVSRVAPSRPDDAPRATYLANAGVLVTDGETKVVFDPLFRNDFGIYELLPEGLERALFAGEPPFDGVDAVFVSHYHEDHFSPADVLRLLELRPEIRLYAPAQAVAGIREIATPGQRGVFDRVHEIALDYGDAPIALEAGSLLIEAVRIPHSGWPERRRDVENISYRVTLDEETTVLHLGDADARDEHFARDAAYWSRRHTDVAFPPYWYFQSEEGRQVLHQRIAPGHAVGVHVPADVPNRPQDRSPELRGYDLFTDPGETRDIPR